MFASLRCRYFGPRTLTEDNLERSQATSLVNLEGGYLLRPHLRLAVEVFNLLNAQNSDIDYYYVSRLPGEPLAGVAGVVTHPTNPRAARVNLVVGF
jgi:hypothetical protein